MDIKSRIDVPKRVFVTGASGFIGRALAQRYRGYGAEVAGVDFAADPEWNVVAGDVQALDRWRGHLDGADLVIHAAAVVSMVAPMRDAWKVNCLGTRRLLTACREVGVKRFVHLSSVAAFGFEFPDGVAEDWPLITNGNSYTDTKITGEHLVLAAHAGGEIDCTIIRPGDVYGPGSRAWIVVPIEMMKTRQFRLPAGGRGVFSPVYIDDLVDGVVLAAGRPEGAGQIFTLAAGTGVTCAEFFGHHWRWLGKSGQIPTLPSGADVVIAEFIGRLMRMAGRASEMGRGTIGLMSRPGTYSIEKARRLLGYDPQVTLADGMKRSEAWVRQKGLV
jgi:nucleoside-diphosphate-sugar epimerase